MPINLTELIKPNAIERALLHDMLHKRSLHNNPLIHTHYYKHHSNITDAIKELTSKSSGYIIVTTVPIPILANAAGITLAYRTAKKQYKVPAVIQVSVSNYYLLPQYNNYVELLP